MSLRKLQADRGCRKLVYVGDGGAVGSLSNQIGSWCAAPHPVEPKVMLVQGLSVGMLLVTRAAIDVFI